MAKKPATVWVVEYRLGPREDWMPNPERVFSVENAANENCSIAKLAHPARYYRVRPYRRAGKGERQR